MSRSTHSEETNKKEILKFLSYNPNSGKFVWGVRPRESFDSDQAHKGWNTRFSGKLAGGVDRSTGYVVIGYKGSLFYAHRLSFLFMTGNLPSGSVDHKNHIRTDNRWENLREVLGSQNAMNTTLRADSTTGVVGVCWHKKAQKWMAHIHAEGKRKHLGLFSDINDAVSARKTAEAENGYHENHGKIMGRIPNYTKEQAENTINQLMSFD